VIAAWIGTWVWLPSVTLTISFLLLLFPHGRLLSTRWRPVAWLAAAVTIAGITLIALAPWDLLDPGVPARNPFEIQVLRDVGIAVPVPILLVGVPTMLLCVASLVVRFRSSRGEERQQLKWFVYASVLNVGTLLIPSDDTSNAVSVLQIATFPMVPVAAGIAILRYRLYDIDVLINRTLVYGALTAMLALAYLGSVVSLQYAFRVLTSGNSQLAIVASTLLIAALFNPLRRRLQASVDRRFYRDKYDARKTLEAFSARLRDEVDLDDLTGELTGAVRDSVRPAYVSLWLKEPGEGR
jgi:hypothetical protein